jgi:hypothetical protein
MASAMKITSRLLVFIYTQTQIYRYHYDSSQMSEPEEKQTHRKYGRQNCETNRVRVRINFNSVYANVLVFDTLHSPWSGTAPT